jgi:hypothetical protein
VLNAEFVLVLGLVTKQVQIFYVASTLYTQTTGFAKLSLLLFYNKLSPAKWWMWYTRISIFILLAYSVAITYAMLFACKPIQHNWNVTITAGSCIDRQKLYISIAALQIMSDGSLVIMLIPMIRRLQMPFWQKIGLVAMFIIGSS